MDNIPLITAEIKIENGLPKLYVEDKKLQPLMFFGNTEADGWEKTLANEIGLAAEKGIHLHSFVVHMPIIKEGQTPDFSHLHKTFDYIIAADSQALLFPRMFLPLEKLEYWHSEAKEDTITYSDGSLATPSPASEKWYKSTSESLSATIKYILSIPKYSKRVIGYHLTPTYFGEWFFQYKGNGVDYCKANQTAFSKYIGKNMPIPDFSDNNALWNETERVFYDFISQPEKLLYQNYINDLIANHICNLSKIVKKETSRKSLVLHFYGYLWELSDGRSGHCSLGEVLKCKDIDMLSSPIGYLNRMEGGIMQYMSPVDSVLLAKKLWMVEDDTRTHLATDTNSEDVSFNHKVKTKEGTYGIHHRNLAAITVRGAGLWWMDLWANGWLGTKDVWDNIDIIKNFYIKYTENLRLQIPEVAVIGDEDGVKAFFNSCCHGEKIMRQNQGSIYTAGINFGLYLIEDLLEDRLVDAKLYIILGSYYMDKEKAEKIKKSVFNKNKTVLWVYGVDSAKGEFISDIMKIKVEKRTDILSAQLKMNNNSLEGESFAIDCSYRVNDKKSDCLGIYDDESCGCAIKYIDKTNSIFYGGQTFSPEFLREIAKIAGVHIYNTDNQVVLANNDLLTVYSTSEGEKTYYLPQKCDVYDINLNKLFSQVTEFKDNIPLNQAKFYIYK